MRYTPVRACLHWAVREGHLAANPLAGRVRQPTPIGRGESARLSEELLTLLLNECPHVRIRELLVMLHQTGMRPGELCTATAAGLKGDYLWVDGKTGRRAVALTEQAAALCREAAKRNPTGPLFRNTRGGPWNPVAITHRFRALRTALRKKGIEVPKTAPPYACRHTYATGLLAAGVPVAHVAAQLGHSPATLHKHYSHLHVSDITPHLVHVKPLGEAEPTAK
jgi:integrase/recombinase XerC